MKDWLVRLNLEKNREKERIVSFELTLTEAVGNSLFKGWNGGTRTLRIRHHLIHRAIKTARTLP